MLQGDVMKFDGLRKRGASALGMLLAAGLAAVSAADDASEIARGKYIAVMMGCNDCHTPNYLLKEGNVSEKLWLTGSAFGWRGPWGTTYPANLRKRLMDFTEDQWVAFAKTMKARPPMPWFDVNQMHEDDLRALYRFVRSLGPDNTPVPAYVPPGKVPNPPYATFPSPPPAK
jgi:mono/diheme cytochrome c family protein